MSNSTCLKGGETLFLTTFTRVAFPITSSRSLIAPIRRISSRTEAEAENLQKMVLAMSKDIRVIVVKLADRLHNMRTLMYLSREKQLKIAKETLEIYAPIAHRIGMNNVYRELEDLAFKVTYPTRHERLTAAVKKNRGGQKRTLNKIQK